MLKEYIQIDDTVYLILSNLEYKGIEMSVILEVKKDEPNET